MHARSQTGFTLIEMVVAFAIFVLAAGALFETFTSARRRNIQAEERELALLTAQSLLSQQRVKPLPWNRIEQGETAEGMEWRIKVSPYDSKPSDIQSWSVVEVDVQVHSKNHPSREVTLRSVEWGGVEEAR